MSGNTNQLELLAKVHAHYQNELWAADNKFAVDYLFSRGFSSETIQTFELGYAPPQLELELSDFEYKTLFDSKHIRQFKYDRFGGRLVFPVKDATGVVRGFCGRLIPPNDGIKYMNSEDSTLYHKKELLFGLHESRETIFKNNKAIICEGYTDVLAFYQKGIRIALATMGTSLTKEHLYQLARYTKNLYFAFDSDKGGEAAYKVAFERASDLGFNIGRIPIPAGKDPAEYLLQPIENTYTN